VKKITSRAVNRVSSTKRSGLPKKKQGDSALETAAPMKPEVNATAPATGDTPATVRQAARDLLANPDAYKAIETEDVAGADGKSSVSNFEKAAQGLIPGASGGAGALNLAARIS